MSTYSKLLLLSVSALLFLSACGRNSDATISTAAVTSFTLIDASTDEAIAGYDPFTDGAVLNLNELPDDLSIRANATGVTESVIFFLNGERIRVENVPPYALGGDNRGDYNPASLPLGEHSIQMVPYPEDGAKGVSGPSFTVRFSVVANSGDKDEGQGEGEAWSDPSTWGGSVPKPGAPVVIPAGKTVILDTDISPETLTINGGLRCANQDLNVTADWIMVHGLLECGTEAQPYTQNLEITLTGDPAEQTTHAGTKFLAAMDAGILRLHGEERDSWLMLDATAEAGSTTLELESAPDWRVGDQIVITTTSESRDENEVRTVKAINGSSVTLDAPLEYRHFGERMSFDNGKSGAEALSWDVDTRGEVALLSRNIKIQGDDASPNPNFQNEGFGAHLMVMNDASAYLAGVELYRVGQTGIQARYPFHWHLTGDVEGQYIKNSSIHESYSRCVTVHGSL